MDIIALYAKGNQGKSETLKRLIALILEKAEGSSFIVSDGYADAVAVRTEIEAERLRRNKSDVVNKTVVLSVLGKTVGICTAGDDAGQLRKPFETFKDKKCDICVCASRPSGGSEEFLQGKKAEGNSLTWVRKTVVRNWDGMSGLDGVFDLLNEKQAEILCSSVMALCGRG